MKNTVNILIVALLLLNGALAFILFGPGFPVREPEEPVSATEVLATEVIVTEAPTTATQTLPPETTQSVETTAPEERFTLTFVGDCTLGSSPGTYYAELGFIKTVGEDLGYPFRNVVSYFEEDDFTMVNLEGVLADNGTAMVKTYNFRGPVKYAQILSQSSIEAVTLANNHTLDYGKKGYESTIAALNGENIPYVERDDIAMVTTASGLKIGLYGMTYAYLDVEDMKAGIAELQKQGAELIVVAPHWGIEGHYSPQQEQKEIAHAAIDAGAHIVYGSHPHVLQPIEVYGDGVIYYSLGNFAFGGNGAPHDMDTVILQQEVIKKADGTVALGERKLIPTCVSSVATENNFQPTPYPEGSKEYDRVLAKLAGTYE